MVSTTNKLFILTILECCCWYIKTKLDHLDQAALLTLGKATQNIIVFCYSFDELTLQTLVGCLNGQCLVCLRTCVYQVLLTGLTSSPITGMLCLSSGIYLTVNQCVVALVSGKFYILAIFGFALITFVYIPVTEEVRGCCQDLAHGFCGNRRCISYYVWISD